MIKDLSFDLLDVLNKVHVDKFGRVSAFLAINKPKGITSHDVVDRVRKQLGTRKVGHVGALDPAADGVMLILVGKKFTRLSDNLMQLDKSYKMEIGFGISTDTLDVEGKVMVDTEVLEEFDFEKLRSIIETFDGGYEQYVPMYSSVKVQGNKLRVLARSYKNFEFFDVEGVKRVRFYGALDESDKEVVLDVPHKRIELSDIGFLEEGIKEAPALFESIGDRKVPYISLEVSCSKGTYIRQLAFDIAKEYGVGGLLLDLRRTRIGSVTLDKCVDVEDVEYPTG